MAKKSDFNMAEEVRKILKESPSITGPECFAEMKKRHPRQKINENSCNVAFYTTRKEMGLSKPRKAAKKQAGATATESNIDRLHRAAKFVAEMGGPDEALSAVQQVAAILKMAEQV